jgi:hypothetical protein
MPHEIGHGLVTINPIGGVPAYGRRPAKGARRIGLCAYCKREGPISEDHVFSRALFERDSDSLIKVPSCDECKDAKDAGEERLRDLVRLDVGASELGWSLRQILRVGRAHLRRPGRSTERIMARKQIEVTSFGGIYLGEAFEIEWDFAPVVRTMEFIVRGLWFHVNREPLPRHADVGVSFIRPLDRQQIHKWLSPFRVVEVFVLGNGVAHVEAFDTFRFTRVDSVWRIVFNFGVLLLAGTGAYARYVRGFTDRREVEGYFDPRICSKQVKALATGLQ